MGYLPGCLLHAFSSNLHFPHKLGGWTMAVNPNTALTQIFQQPQRSKYNRRNPLFYLNDWTGGTSADECKETLPHFFFFSLLTLPRDQPICRTVLLRQLSRDVNHK